MIDVSYTGSIVFNYPSGQGSQRRPDAISERAPKLRFEKTSDAFVEHTLDRKLPSCLADVVSQHGDITLDDVGTLMSITRERVRQIETKALKRFARSGVLLGIFESEEVAEQYLTRILKR